MAKTETHHAPVSPHFFYLVFAVLFLGAALVLLRAGIGPLTFAFVCVAWVLSVVVHEFGHAIVAYRGGDTTVADKGYLTLDPLRYANWQTTLLMPVLLLALGGIGFPGAAVYIQEGKIRTRLGRSLASLAGPGGTLAVLFLLNIILAVMVRAGWWTSPLYPALAFLAFLQATALILNLLPIPGFDGYGVIRAWLPDSVKQTLKPVEGIAFIVVFMALLFLPQAGQLLFGTAADLAQALGAPVAAAQTGLDHFQFWKGLAAD